MAETPNKTELSTKLLEQVSNPFLLGADPEFFVVNPPDGRVYNAPPYTTAFKNTSGAVGADHGGRVWELRPTPSPSAYGVVTNIWKLLKSKELSTVEQFRWKSGGALGLDTIGGHVHFGMRAFNPSQLIALDSITKGLSELEILPSAEATRRFERHPEYFSHDRVRECMAHAEYRAACSWLDKPGQALACLTAYKLAAVDPESVVWPKVTGMQARFIEWLEWAAQKDIDAFLVHRLILKRGFKVVQADPGSDFKPLWRKEELWSMQK